MMVAGPYFGWSAIRIVLIYVPNNSLSRGKYFGSKPESIDVIVDTSFNSADK